MVTRKPLYRWFHLLLTAILLAGLFWGLQPLRPTRAAEIILGGNAVEGDLRVHMHAVSPNGYDGLYTIYRYASGSWQPQFYLGTSYLGKDSRLYANGIGYNFGFYYSTTGDQQMNPQSHVLSGDTVTTVWTSGDLRVTQLATYHAGTAYVQYHWEVQNLGSIPQTDLRFFHGGTRISPGETTGRASGTPPTTASVQKSWWGAACSDWCSRV